MSTAYTAYKTIAAEGAEVPVAEPADAQLALAERNELILEELPQVYFIAARILERLPQHVQLEDLVNAGVIGLLEAHKNFDGAKNASFKTFAKFRIRGAILDSLRELDWGSRSLRRKAREIAEATTKLEGVLGRQPAKEEVAHALGMKPAQLDEAMTQLDGLHIVGQQVASFDGEDVVDLIESAPSSWANPFELYCRAEEKTRLIAAVAALSEREQLILSLYYREELTMKEVAKVVGIALSRVSQIHFAAIQKLKQALGVAERRMPPDNRGMERRVEQDRGAENRVAQEMEKPAQERPGDAVSSHRVDRRHAYQERPAKSSPAIERAAAPLRRAAQPESDEADGPDAASAGKVGKRV